MRPKGKLFALFVIVVAIGLVTATGAFSSVSATRTATVNVAGDSSALLQVQPHDGPNGFGGGSPTSSQGYAQLTSGELEINLAGFGSVAGSGPNLNATTDLKAVFNITNHGSQSVDVNISDNETTGADGVVTFYNATSAPLNANDPYGGIESDSSGQKVTLADGDTVVISIYIDTTLDASLTDGDGLIDEITIYAEPTP